MYARNSMRIVSLKSVDRSSIIIALLATFFLGGSFLGHRFFEHLSDDSYIYVSTYLIDFFEVSKLTPPKATFFRTTVLFFIYPVIVFLCGISPLGFILIPGISFSLGFGVFFTIQCFLAVFSRAGIYPAMVLLSIRVIFTLICLLILSVEVLPQSWRLAQVTIRNHRLSDSVFHGRRLAALVIFCTAIMFLGVCCEKFLTPVLLQFVLSKFFQ